MTNRHGLSDLIQDAWATDIEERVREAAHASPALFAAQADDLLARIQNDPSRSAARLATKNEARLVFLGLTSIGRGLEPRWDPILPFAWGDAVMNERLADALGPQRTVTSVVQAMSEMYDVHAVRLALDLLPRHPAEPLVHAVLDLLRKRGFGAQFPKAKAEKERLRARLDEIAAGQPLIAEHIASYNVAAAWRKKR